MKINLIISNKINIYLVIFILVGLTCLKLKGQNYFSKNNFNFFNQYSISGGILINQAQHSQFGYKPNNKPLITINANALHVKNLDINVGLGFREKSLIGYGNYPWLRLVNNLPPITSVNFQPFYKINFSYLNADVSFKITFLKKYKLQPFVFVGARYNKILKYSDSLELYNKYYSSTFKTRDNYINPFFGLGCNYSINSNISFHILFEQNNDIIANKQVYFNSNIKDDEIRFLSYSFQIGVQYTLQKKIIK